jgi:hypothetical protein
MPLREIFEKNCLLEIPLIFCYIGNICGYISTIIWFIVLVPQIYKNYCRKTTFGISLFWIYMNFTASLCNIFFAFRLNLPFYSKLMGVYMPFLHFLTLIQYFIYNDGSIIKRISLFLIIFTISSILFYSNYFFPVLTNFYSWVSLVLWSLEMFPQLYLNFKLNTTEGQSSITIMLAFIGKTTDIISTYAINFPIQIIIMNYLSSSTAYFNNIQMTYYFDIKKNIFFKIIKIIWIIFVISILLSISIILFFKINYVYSIICIISLYSTLFLIFLSVKLEIIIKEFFEKKKDKEESSIILINEGDIKK